ncbi:MAG TPA: FAD-dependent oxidoreductase [Amnibacterium sp.]|jgi:hypothetical protein|uniref:NAD(P)/FAD-dependent oxidoreductase n=1 Tax=Amnibacterium sp. TaxID=1872496 RepID=UPI002F92EABA
MSVVVVGAGMSGIACARRLTDAGVAVRVVDRGRRVGGRMAARTLRDMPDGPHPVDLGAPYCTVSDDGFRAVVDAWLAAGVAREWTDTFRTAGPDGLGEAKPGPVRFAGTGGMRGLVEHLAAGIDVTDREAVDADGFERLAAEADAVVLAIPGPQAARLLTARPALARIADQRFQPAIAVMARFERRTWPEFDAAFVADLPIRWLADDGRSRGDGAPVLVAHTTSDFAASRLDDAASAIRAAVDAMRGVLESVEEPVETFAQRWTFAQPAEPRDGTFHLSDDGIGLCGDGWSTKSRVEAAWRSGTDLADALIARLT